MNEKCKYKVLFKTSEQNTSFFMMKMEEHVRYCLMLIIK